MKNLVYLVLLFVAFSAQAQQKNKNAKVNIEVNGNCEQCKKRIEKAAYSVPGVKSAEWHIDDKVLHLIINETKCSVADVEKAIAKIGHDTNNVKASDDTYNKLHHCCKYDRKE